MKKQIHSFFLAAIMIACFALTAYAKEDAGKDNVFPELTFITVQNRTVHPGRTVVISADAQNDDSSVKSITAIFANKTENTEYSVKLLPNSDKDVMEEYSGILHVPKGAPPGEYRLRHVVVLDQDDNRARYNAGQTSRDEERGRFPLEWDAAFTVQKDEVLPKPVSCAVTQSAGRYILTFGAGGTELDKATLLFENSWNSHKYVASVSSGDLGQDGLYRKEIPISPYEPSGTFTLKQVVIKGLAGKSQTWSASIDEGNEDTKEILLPIATSFAVNSSYFDAAPPELLSIALGSGVRDTKDKKTRYPIRAIVTDDLSGVEHITISFKDPISGKTVGKVLWDSDLIKENQYAGEMSVKFDQTPGRYELDSVTLCDCAGNRITYCDQEDLTDKKRALPVTVSVSVNK